MGVRGVSGLALPLLALQGHTGGQAGAGVPAQPQGTCRGSRGGGMGLSYLSSLLSLEFLREPAGAGEGLVPTEALLGVAREGDSGGDTTDGAGTVAGPQAPAHQCECSEANRILPRRGFAPHGECPSACGRMRAPSHIYPPRIWVRASPKGIDPQSIPRLPGDTPSLPLP